MKTRTWYFSRYLGSKDLQLSGLLLPFVACTSGQQLLLAAPCLRLLTTRSGPYGSERVTDLRGWSRACELIGNVRQPRS